MSMSGSSESSAIQVKGVSKKFVLDANRPSSLKEAFLRRNREKSNDFWALDDVSFTIPKGSFFGIIGHNGSGKSTILRLMAGIHRPTSGSIETNGRISALLELGSGFHPDLTGRENIFLNGAMLGLGRQQMEAAVDEIVEFSGIGEFIDAPVKVYSSGMHVRLGFAVAVHVDPEILLVDEVLAVGDEEFQRKCLDHIHTLRRKGVTIVLVAHSPQLMQTMCDQVAWLDHGKLRDIGDPLATVDGYIRHVNEQENERLLKQRNAKAELRQAEAKLARPQTDNEASADQAGDSGPLGGNARSSDTADLALPDPTIDEDRQGSGEIRILQVQYLDADGNERVAGSSGDALVIRLWYKAKITIERSTFGLGIYTEQGIHVAQVNNRHSDVVQPVISPGTGFVDVTLEHLVLLPSTYYLTTGIHSGNQMHCYDLWSQAHKFVVQPGSSREHGALVELQADFSEAAAAELHTS